jgi:hypothetical protein
MRLAALVLLLAACGGDDQLLAPAQVASFPLAAKSELDVLLLIDNTVNGDNQRALSVVPDQLFALGNASLHIGIATSDLGTTGSLDGRAAPGQPIGSGNPGGCSGSGQDGVLQVKGDVVVSGSYLAIGSDGSTNFQGTLADTLQKMILQIGVAGCGFEQTLAGVDQALTNPANAGFRRPDASLAIIVLSDEDDCSVRDSAFFDPSQTSPLGPVTSFRCTKQGVTCDQDLGSAGAKTNCRPSEGNEYIEDLSDLLAPVKASETDPLRLAISAIIGPPTPFAVEDRALAPGNAPLPALAQSCNYTDSAGMLTVADPAVRIAAWTAALNGQTYDICQNDYSDTAAGINHQLSGVLVGDRCLHELIPAGTTCDVRSGTTIIPPCPVSGAACYTFVTDDAQCATTPGHQLVQLTDEAALTAPSVVVTCQLPE